jgi:serine/threonine protein kinase
MIPQPMRPESSRDNRPIPVDERLATIHQEIVDTEHAVASELDGEESPRGTPPTSLGPNWPDMNACLTALERLRRDGFAPPPMLPLTGAPPPPVSTTEIKDAGEEHSGFESGPTDCHDPGMGRGLGSVVDSIHDSIHDNFHDNFHDNEAGTRDHGKENGDAVPHPAGEPTSHDSEQPLHWGRFIIRGELGRGGQGIVFLAHDPQLDRDVALKIPRPEVVMTQPLRDRFLREAQMAARLDHPHLVPVFEAGEIGPVCYLTTAYCSGMTLAHWLQSQSKPVDFHLAARLVMPLSEAVHYIHRHGIVHRDLKPGNVILQMDAKGPDAVTVESPAGKRRREAGGSSSRGDLPFIPRLTDFGLAKLDDGQSGNTRTGSVIGTLQYMAPEQVDGRNVSVSPRTDVYGLGAILYELLTGQPPFPRQQTEVETLRSIMRNSPAVPRALRADIPSDLQAICLKAMSWDPAKRYESAAAMADDLQRFLDCRPVGARPPTPWGRLGRWGRRNPVVATLASSLTLLLLAGLTTVTLLWQQAAWNEELARSSQNRTTAMFQQAHRAVREFHHVLFTEEQYNAPEFQPVRRELLEKTLKYYQAFLEQQIDPALLRADIADAHYQLAFVHSTLGAKEEAARLFRESLPWWRQLLEEHPDSSEYRYFLGKTLHALAWLAHGEGDLSTSRALYAETLETWKVLVDMNPDNAGHQVDLATFLHNFACLHASCDELELALQQLTEAQRLAQKVLTGSDRRSDARLQLAGTYSKLGALRVVQKEFSQAAEDLNQARELFSESIHKSIRVPDSERGLAEVLRRLGKLHRKQDDLSQAAQYYGEAQARLERLAIDFPDMARIKETLASNCQALAAVHEDLGEFEEAGKRYREAWQLREEILELEPSSENARQDVARICRKLGQFYVRTDSLEEAGDCLNRASDICQSVEDSCGAWENLIGKVITLRHKLARTYRKQGNGAECRAQLELAMSLLGPWKEGAPESQHCLELYVDWKAENDQLVELESSLSGPEIH